MIWQILFIVSIFGPGCWSYDNLFIRPRICEKCYDAKGCRDCYLRHYAVKGCTPVYKSGYDCPVRYNCPEKQPDSVCHFRGKTYKLGESIDSGNPCNLCSCGHGADKNSLEINCEFVNCVGLPSHNDTCYRANKQGSCCPYLECLTDEVAKKTVCEQRGRTYRYGEVFFPESKSGLCICNENWNGDEDSSCYNYGCMNLDLSRKKLQNGCIPIYDEDDCCPRRFLCAENTNITTVSKAEKKDIDSGNTCVFKDIHYAIGQKLDYKGHNNCTSCYCLTPPDFTCVNRKCPPSPPVIDNRRFCAPKQIPGECCPSYDCLPSFGILKLLPKVYVK